MDGDNIENSTLRLTKFLLIRLVQNQGYPWWNGKRIYFESINNERFSAYIRVNVKDKHGVLSDITKTMAKNKVSVKRLIQNPYKSKKYSSIVIVTHTAKNIFLKKTIIQLSKRNYLIEKPKLIRIENV